MRPDESMATKTVTIGADEPASSSRPSVRAPRRRAVPALKRERIRKADSQKRAPLAAQIPRATKRMPRRGAPEQTPAYIRSVGAALGAADREYVRRKLGRKLGKFAASIERVSVRVEDINGPRGGVDKLCRIKVVLSGLPSVVVDERHQSLQAAMDRALTRVEGAVRRATQRRRTKALTPRAANARRGRGALFSRDGPATMKRKQSSRTRDSDASSDRESDTRRRADRARGTKASRPRIDDRTKQALDEELDEGLKGTFPASDPVSLTQP